MTTTITNREAAEICTALGHLPKGIKSDNRRQRHSFHCQCGYVCTNRKTKQLAVQAGIHHMRSVAIEAKKNGLNAPGKALQNQNVGATL